jgi:hypothetical protein
MRNAVRSPEIAAQAGEAYSALIGPLRAVAMAHGYAIGVHGSLARDIDLIVVPWTVEASDQAAVARALIEEVKRVNGHVFVAERVVDVDPYDFTKRSPEPKPHGRMSWSLHLGGAGAYVDLAIFPPLANPVQALHAAIDASVCEQQERQRQFDQARVSEELL